MAAEPADDPTDGDTDGDTDDDDESGPGRAPRRLVPALRRRANWVVIPANRPLERLRPLEAPIWLVGDGRSGTTWAGNVINHRNQYRYLFEPFHPDFVPAAAAIPKYCYLSPGDRHHEAYDYAARVFSGRLQHRRIDKLNRSLRFRGLLVKDIFSHLMLGWADAWFPDVRKILLLRHPFAVALSKMDRPTWSWVRDPAALLAQPDLVRDHLAPHVAVLESATTEFERLVAIWAVLHAVPLAQLDPGRVLLVFYEDMLTDPTGTLQRIWTYLGKDPDADGARLQRVVDRASETSGARSGQASTRGVDDWRARVTPDQIRRGVEFLAAFGLDAVYNESAMPDRPAAEALLAR